MSAENLAWGAVHHIAIPRQASVSPLWISNEVEVKATPAVIKALAARGDVREIQPERTIQAPPRPPSLRSASSAAIPAAGAAAPSSAAALAAAAPEPNIAKINAPALWGLGFTGQGVVVANLDTGVDVTQPDLAGRWRGGTNSWFDPHGQHATPTDINGHGTWTMGVMVGGDAGGTSVGVAPGARWIAAKIFNDKGAATTTAIHQSFQWLLDPDGNPATADAPNVVNNSWSGSAAGCGLEFQPDLQNLRAAGILPVFAAGNDGRLPGTVFSPANLPPAFAVSGTDNADVWYSSSSVGPSPCAGATTPKLSAPGVSVRTTDLFGGYTVQNGTSLSAPHVAGGLALLLSAFPGTSVHRQEAAIEAGAVDLGTAGLDNTFGFGRLDVLAAFNWLGSAADFGLAATPSSATTAPGAVASYSHSAPLILVVPSPGDFAVGATPASRTVAAGSATSYTVNVGAVNGFTGNVTLTLGGLPGTVGTASFTPTVVAGGAGSSQLTITTVGTAPAGKYTLTVTGTSGSTVHTAAVTLSVTNFGLSASPSSASVKRGRSVTYSAKVTALNGFTGTVTLSSSGAPAGVTTGGPGTRCGLRARRRCR